MYERTISNENSFKLSLYITIEFFSLISLGLRVSDVISNPSELSKGLMIFSDILTPLYQTVFSQEGELAEKLFGWLQ